MAALDLGQWSAVGAIVATHSTSPTLVAAVDRELAAAREAAATTGDAPASDSEPTQTIDTDPVRLGGPLNDVIHVLGGDTCREFLGAAHGYCGATPASFGLCDAHREQRRQQLAREGH